MKRKIHLDISDEAAWRSACGVTPAENGRNLSVADNQVTCRKCLAAMGYVV